jgi:hypothetical protein
MNFGMLETNNEINLDRVVTPFQIQTEKFQNTNLERYGYTSMQECSIDSINLL